MAPARERLSLSAWLATKPFPLNADLLDAIGKAQTDDMLEEIARADYGMDYGAHLAALHDLRARKPQPTMMGWEPREVLELFRWSEYGDNRTGQIARSKVAFHLMRAFCCGCLIEAYRHPRNAEVMDGTNETVIQFLESVKVLGPEYERDLPAFLGWCFVAAPDADEETGFFALALAWSILRSAPLNSEWGEHVRTALDAADVAFERQRDVWPEGPNKRYADTWLLAWAFHDQRHPKWIAWATEMGVMAVTIADPELRDRILEVTTKLTVPGAWRTST